MNKSTQMTGLYLWVIVAKYCETSTITDTKEFSIDSADFRQKIRILDKKTTSTQSNKTFKISTIHKWIKKYKDTESLQRNPGSGKKPKIDDLEKFKKIDNPDSTQKELGQLYGGAS